MAMLLSSINLTLRRNAIIIILPELAQQLNVGVTSTLEQLFPIRRSTADIHNSERLSLEDALTTTLTYGSADI